MSSLIVFFNVPHISIGRGGVIWEKEVIEYLNRTGKFKAKLITTDCCFRHFINVGFDYEVVPLKKLLNFSYFDYKLVRKELRDADIVYYFNAFIGSDWPIIKHIMELNTIIFGYHAGIFDTSMFRRIYYEIQKYLIRDKGYHHVLTKYYYNLLTRKKFKNVFILPNFVDTQIIRPCKEKIRKLIVAPGATTKEKGIDTLINIARFKKDIEIYITGDKPLQKLPSNIKYLGKLERMENIKLLSKATICILPSKAETFSFSLLECLATGNLIIARDLPTLREVAGNIKSVYFANNDQGFILGLDLFSKIVENESEFDELSKISRERSLIFDKNIILSNFYNILTKISNSDLDNKSVTNANNL